MPVVLPPSNPRGPIGARRAGRPRKAGARYPSGQLRPAEQRGDAPAPALVRRVLDAALREGGEPLLGSSLGRLFMRGGVTAPQLAAGLAYARLRGRYDRAMGLPRRSATSPDYGAARAAPDRRAMTEGEVAALKDRYARTLGVLSDGAAAGPAGAYAGRRTATLLERVCVDDLACEGYELDRLKTALELLVPWFGVDPEKNI